MMGLVFGLPLVSITSLSINLSSQINVYYCIANLASTISFVKDLILMRFSLFRCSIFFAIAMTILKCAPIALERTKCLILNSFVGLYGVVYKPLFLEDTAQIIQSTIAKHNPIEEINSTSLHWEPICCFTQTIMPYNHC